MMALAPMIVSASAAGAGAPSRRASLYAGMTSAGTPMDFQLSASGHWVRSFHFGSPVLACSTDSASGVVGDGNFPLRGLRVKNGSFAGRLLPHADSPSDPAPYQSVALVRGRFNADRHQVSGTVTTDIYGCSGQVQSLTFIAKRVRALPARPTRGGSYTGVIPGRADSPSGLAFSFKVSRSGRRVVALRIGHGFAYCLASGLSHRFALARSYPLAGLPQDAAGAFAGTFASRLTARGRAAGTRVRVSMVFLSAQEATGTFRLLNPACRMEPLAWTAQLSP